MAVARGIHHWGGLDTFDPYVLHYSFEMQNGPALVSRAVLHVGSYLWLRPAAFRGEPKPR